MKQCVKVLAISAVCAASLYASGWRIPEQSLNSTALSAAYVANANGADASYYNPANMAFIEDGSLLEAAMTYIRLPEINYKDNASSTRDSDSKVENFLIPTFHYVSPAVNNNWRFGFSTVAPGGLSKRWDETYAKTFAEEFSLQIIELNPTASYKVNDKFAVGFGFRGIYIDGVVKSDGIIPTPSASALGITAATVKRDMEGDSIDFGYNLALSYKAMDNLTLSTTYRSKINLTVEGKADLTGAAVAGAAAGTVFAPYSGDVSVTIPLPASLVLAASYTMNKTTFEFVYEKTYWSAYKNLDFNYASAITNPILKSVFDDVKPKNWEDANAYRIGITHQYNDKLRLMVGFAYDEAGATDKDTLGFELPDSNAKLYSLGVEYKISENTKVGLAYLYDEKDSKSAVNGGGVNGEFTDGSAHLVTASFKYRF